jgi:protein-L-isoaspartate(D-aspartate) O-methyltransferase
VTNTMPSVADARAAYARRICAGLECEALEPAFARVPREDFMGPGPWQLIFPDDFAAGYQTTPDGDPRHLYQDVLVALDAGRGINNGHPSSLARWLAALDLNSGDRVAHVGCGVGYYSAVMATIAGESGELIGLEFDPMLADRAQASLARHPQVVVHCGDGSAFPLTQRDAIFASAGATTPMPWLAALAPNGRLLLPLTVSAPEREVGAGHYLLVTRRGAGFAARFISPVGIFHCVGARSDAGSKRLAHAFQAGGHDEVRSLRTAPHEREVACWLHAEDFCLSRAIPDPRDGSIAG